MPRASDGFTLIELVVVVVILGFLAAIAIPRFTGAQRRAYDAAMVQDMRNLAVHQQLFYEQTINAFQYADDLADLTEYETSDGVQVVLEQGGRGGWSARATHGAMPGIECVVYHGSAAALTTAAGLAPAGPGVIACDRS